MEIETTFRSTPSRHEKSLGLLTMKFVSLLQEANDGVLDLKVVSEAERVLWVNGGANITLTGSAADLNKWLSSQVRCIDVFKDGEQAAITRPNI